MGIRLKSMKTMITILAFLVVSCAGLETRKPFYKSNLEKNLNPNLKIELLELGYYRDVSGDWWGEKFYITTLKVTNTSDKYRWYGLCAYDKKFTKDNLDFTIRNNFRAKIAYDSNPAQFDVEGFYKGYERFHLLLGPESVDAIPLNTYQDKPVFPVINFEGKNYVSAAMTSCNFGIPMSRDTDRSSSAVGWLAPNDTRIIRTIFSVPARMKFEKIVQPNIYRADNLQAMSQKPEY